MLQDLVTLRPPAPNRVRYCDDHEEHHLHEAAVMLAFAMYLMRHHDLPSVRIHPDGEHGKQFDIRRWLGSNGFELAEQVGSTSYGGHYTDKARRTVTVLPSSGKGDVVAETDAITIIGECKGGVINTRHPGQKSRLYKGLCETVGMLMTLPRGGMQYAVVPRTAVTERLAERLAPRCSESGIEIALVDDVGRVSIVRPAS